MKHIKTFESFLNEGDMTKDYDGFILLDTKHKKNYKFKYVKGSNNVKVENDAIAKAMKETGEPRSSFMVNGFVRKGEWDKDPSEVLESYIFEGYMSELDIIRQEAKNIDDFIKNAKKEFPEIAKMKEADVFLHDLWEIGKQIK